MVEDGTIDCFFQLLTLASAYFNSLVKMNLRNTAFQGNSQQKQILP